MTEHPYKSLEPRAYWRTAVADRSPFAIADLWQPKFEITTKMPIITAGSCFAQHFSRALVARGYSWIDAEPAPPLLPAARHAAYHFGTFSFRTGNIYTPRMLRQWLSWASGQESVPDMAWEKDGRLYDPFRPAIEPEGFRDLGEMNHLREVTLCAIRRAVSDASVFVFTLGLTEAWRDADTGVEFAICPGTTAGKFDPDSHVFVNSGFMDIHADLAAATALLREMNPEIRMLLTVSPVPLTATASCEHVVVATSHSKAVLRAVAGEYAAGHPDVDYFPSYEVIASPVFRGMFYQPNQRQVISAGVDFVMSQFFACQQTAFSKAKRPARPTSPKERAAAAAAELRCEEELLDAFSL